MTTKQSNRVNMAKILKQLFSAEQTKYEGNNPLVTRISEFNSIVDNLESLATVQSTDTTANTSLKTDARLLMINLTVAYANSAADYFDDKNSPLSKQLTTNKTKIKNMSGVEAKIYCNKLYTLVNDNIGNLNPDYVTITEAEQWLTAINNFDAKAYDAGLSKDTTKNATKFLEEEFKKLNACLKKLDRLMKKYDILNPSFHGNYKISRKISDLGTRHDNEIPLQG
ncbi:hypothetical protein [Chryseobacterium sp. YIM B08800]|uniref:hypothetical protein n=1 Tax=Chryseobacterium sp. YIM B08800 TaxID=2984136 RepID=UPI0022405D84|nr:hypothetical protein [Chryseobacterium sp. YIM B08800]